MEVHEWAWTQCKHVYNITFSTQYDNIFYISDIMKYT